jgi:hypothetical protein
MLCAEAKQALKIFIDKYNDLTYKNIPSSPEPIQTPEPTGGPKISIEDKKILEEAKKLPFPVSLDAIPYKLAYNAHRGTSFSPDRRAESARRGYIQHLLNAYYSTSPLAVESKQKDILKDELKDFDQTLQNKLKSLLNSRGGLMSTMVTGRGNFPVKSQRKKNQVFDKKTDDFLKWESKAVDRIKKRIKAAKSGILIEDETTEFLKNKVLNTIATIKSIKEGGGLGDVNLFKTSLVNKLKTAAKNGHIRPVQVALNYLGELQRTQLKKPAYTIKHSVWKIADQAKEKQETRQTGEIILKEYSPFDIKILTDYDDNRTRIFFPDKPGDEVRNDLKRNGWKWSPNAGAWQRKATTNAEQNAIFLMDKYFLV